MSIAPVSSSGPSPTLRVLAGVPSQLSAQPAPLNLNLYAGDDVTMVLPVRDSAGRPVDLSGATIRSHIRSEPFGPGPAVPGPPSPPPPPLLGQFLPAIGDSEIFLHLTGAVSAILPKTSVWDVELTLGGVVTTLAGGTLTMAPEVSR